MPERVLDTPVDYESSSRLGAIMGSGGMIVMDERDVHGGHGPFLHGVHPGRILRQVHALPRRHEAHARDPRTDHRGQGRGRGHRTARGIEPTIQESALCGLGQTGPNPVLSTLRYFRDEYEAHIHEKRCPAKRCAALLKFEVDAEKCKKCGVCFKECPVHAIEWSKKETAVISGDASSA